MQLFQSCRIASGCLPRVAATPQPWAERWNPYGIHDAACIRLLIRADAAFFFNLFHVMGCRFKPFQKGFVVPSVLLSVCMSQPDGVRFSRVSPQYNFN